MDDAIIGDRVDRHRLRDRDLLKGLLITLVHEVYTHGEVEFILPLFQRWAREELGLPADDAQFAGTRTPPGIRERRTVACRRRLFVCAASPGFLAPLAA